MTTTTTTDLVSKVAEGEGLIESQPVLDTITKGLEAGLGIKVELVNAFLIQPSLELSLQALFAKDKEAGLVLLLLVMMEWLLLLLVSVYLRKVPVVESDERNDTLGEDIIDNGVVVVNTLLVCW